MCRRERVDTTFHRGDELRRGLGLGEPQHRQHDGKRVLGAMVDLARQQDLALFRPLAVGDVDADAVQTYRSAFEVTRYRRGAETPAHLGRGTDDAELGL